MFKQRWQIISFTCLCLFPLAACDLTEKIDERVQREENTPDILIALEGETDSSLPEPVSNTLQAIRETLKTGSLRQLARLAGQYDGFRSNYGGLDDYEHWYLMKRAGLDPMEKTLEVLDQPYGIKDFGAEKYYIWPAFAVRSPEELDFSRLSFSDRAKLLELVGENGVERMKAGETYPGFRLAIREDGSWVYLLQDN